MTENTTEASEVESTEPISYEKGSWQESLQQSSNLLDRSAKARKRASGLLWKGARSGIEAWLPNSATDIAGEALYADVIEALGKSRKGDASKIKTVAVAVRSHGLDLATFPNLSKAYAEATRLTKTVAEQAVEDDAAEKAIEAIEAPNSTTTVDGAALLLLSKGLDGAVVAILDALGAKNFEAHRAFVRAVSTEVSARVQAAKPKPTPKVATQKAGATPAKKTTAKKATATPTKVKTKGRPAGQGAAKPTQAETPVEQAEEQTDRQAEVVEQAPAPAPAKKRAIVRRPGR